MKPHRILLTLILLSALGLRLCGIQWALPTGSGHTQSFHPDETGNLNSIINANPEKFKDYNRFWYLNKGEAMYFAWSFVIWVTGTTDAKNNADTPANVVAGRLLACRLSVVFLSLIGVWLTYLLGKRISDRRTGLCAALIMAAIPVNVVASHYMKTDIPAQTALVLSLLLIVRARERQTPAAFFAAGLTAGLAVGVKYNLVILLFPVLFILWDVLRAKGFVGSMKARAACVGGGILGVLISTPDIWLNFDRFMLGVREQWIVQGALPYADNRFRPMPLIDYITRIFPWGWTVGLEILLLCGLFALFMKKRRNAAVLLIWSVFYFLFLFRSQPFVRYTVLLVPGLAVLAPTVFFRLRERFPRLGFPIVFASACIILYAATYSLACCNMMAGGDPRSAAKEWIEKHAAKGAAIAMDAPGLYYNPPVDPTVYDIVDTPARLGGLNTDRFDFFIASSFRYRQPFRKREIDPAAHDFYRWAFNSDYFRKVAEFKTSPTIGSLSFRWDFPPHDWLYPGPTIVILKKVKRFQGPAAGLQPERSEGDLIIIP